jgi:hypothetical protein
MGPPLHVNSDGSVDCVPLMNEYDEMKAYASAADAMEWQLPQWPTVPGPR